MGSAADKASGLANEAIGKARLGTVAHRPRQGANIQCAASTSDRKDDFAD
jgi:hypothetical protein